MIRRRPSSRRGSTMLLMAFVIPVLIGMVAFAIEIGRIYLVRAQLQTAVDAGALAAGLQLRDDPNDVDAALAVGLDYVQRNRAGAFATVPADAIQVDSGKWNSDSRSFSATSSSPDAIQVSGTLDKEPMFFGRIFGWDTFATPRSAIAIGGGGPVDVMLALDLSGSMGSQGRIGALRDAAPVFLNVLQSAGDGYRVGVMGYGALISRYDPVSSGHSGTSYTNAPSSLYPHSDDWCAVLEAPLTFDLDYLRTNVLDHSTLVANKYNGWTPIGAALRDSSHYLHLNARSGVEKVVVLMSDGRANKPNGNGPGYAVDMAYYAVSLGIKVYTISLGNGADEDLMQQIADITGGEHFIASGSAGGLSAALADAFADIAEAIQQTQLVQ